MPEFAVGNRFALHIAKSYYCLLTGFDSGCNGSHLSVDLNYLSSLHQKTLLLMLGDHRSCKYD